MTDKVAAGLEISKRIDALAAFLREHRETEWAERLDVAVAGGSTGTESLFRVRGVLVELAKGELAERLGITKAVRSLDHEIDRHLKLS